MYLHFYLFFNSQEMSEKWMEKAQTYLNELNPKAALAKIEKYLFYNPGYALAFIMKETEAHM